MTLAALDLRELLILAVFVGLPVLRGIMESRKKAGEAKSKPAAPGGRPTGPRPGEDGSGGDLWERMLRGELPEPPEEAPGSPAEETAYPVESFDQVYPVEAFEPAPAPVPVPATGQRPAATTAWDEERVAEALARENAALAERWGEAALEPQRPAIVEGYSDPGDAPGEGSNRSRGLARMERSGFDLRQAVLASEILGPPVSLRRPGVGASTPPGLTD